MLVCSELMAIARHTGIHPLVTSYISKFRPDTSALMGQAIPNGIGWNEHVRFMNRIPSESSSILKSFHIFPGCLCAAISEYLIEKQDHCFLGNSLNRTPFPSGSLS